MVRTPAKREAALAFVVRILELTAKGVGPIPTLRRTPRLIGR
jgi:hypothetical protein